MEDLKGILARHSFNFKKQFGQNFISDTNLLKSIVAASEVDKASTVVEIGCGAGTLTRVLSQNAGMVYAFEIDTALQPVLGETLRGCENVEVIFKDFEKVNLKQFEKEIGEYTVVANLPYYITTPLVMRFLEEGERVKSLVIMVQEEVALRFCAEANTPDYGAVTAAIALRASAKIIKRVPASMFHPRPKVDSAVVKIDFEQNRLPVLDKKLYRDTVRCAFLNRRKTLENNLVNYFKLSRERAQAVLEKANVPQKARGETLTPQALARLSDVLFEELKQDK
ncbi:MAG: ribosomal RNA small subunit methyltransferase A [Clostridia bacterium]|nr:ribosomal RNA small subunit methyltransferase A [Clostridia bacterium]